MTSSLLTTTDDAPAMTSEPVTRRVRSDLWIGVGLLGVAVVGRLAWSVVDSGLLPWT